MSRKTHKNHVRAGNRGASPKPVPAPAPVAEPVAEPVAAPAPPKEPVKKKTGVFGTRRKDT